MYFFFSRAFARPSKFELFELIVVGGADVTRGGSGAPAARHRPRPSPPVPVATARRSPSRPPSPPVRADRACTETRLRLISRLTSAVRALPAARQAPRDVMTLLVLAARARQRGRTTN